MFLYAQSVYIDPSKPLCKQLLLEKTEYIINSDIDMSGKVVVLPSGSSLVFKHGAKIKDGTIVTKSDTKVLNGCFEYTLGCNSYKTYHQRLISSPLIAESCDNVLIKNCIFKFNSNTMVMNCYSVAIYGYEQKSSRIIIEKCQFEVYGVGLFNNTQDSKIHACNFKNMYNTLAVETLYDKHPYRHPENIEISNCNFEITKSSELDISSIWISGISGLKFNRNKIEALCSPILLYCGDGNIALANIEVTGNIFKMKDYYYPQTSTTIQIVGKSYIFMDKDSLFGSNIIISNNSFKCCNNSYYFGDQKERAIGVMFVKDIIIEKNKFTGYSDGIVVFDKFKKYKSPSTSVKMYENIFKEISGNSIHIADGIKFYQIDKSSYKKVNNKIKMGN